MINQSDMICLSIFKCLKTIHLKCCNSKKKKRGVLRQSNTTHTWIVRHTELDAGDTKAEQVIGGAPSCAQREEGRRRHRHTAHGWEPARPQLTRPRRRRNHTSKARVLREQMKGDPVTAPSENPSVNKHFNAVNRKNIWKGCPVPLIYVKIYTEKEASDPAMPECSLTILYLLPSKAFCWETESCPSENVDAEERGWQRKWGTPRRDPRTSDATKWTDVY